MRKITFTIPLLFLMCPLILNAQYSGFDLSRYKLPDIKLTRLDTYFGLENSVYRNHYKLSDGDSSKSRTNSIQNTLNLDYYYFRNTEKYQGVFNAVASGYTNLYKAKNENYYLRNNTNYASFLISSTNRFYNQTLSFIEVNPYVSVDKNVRNNYYEPTESDSEDSTNDQFNTDLSLSISVGHGRVEPIEDLRLAIYILEELNKAGLIDSLPSDIVVLDMAKEISRIKRQRFFDTRVRKISELQVLDSFLIANGIISNNDINYFAVVNDQWDYASGPERLSGFAIKAGIDDRISISRSHQEVSYNNESPTISETNTNAFFIAGFTSLRYEKPVNLYWQTSATINVSYGIESRGNPEDRDNLAENYRTNIFNTNLGYSIQFLPNSRTSARLNLSFNFNNSKGDRQLSNPDPAIFQMTSNRLTINTGFNMYYYISPQFRVQLNSDLFYYTLHDLRSNNSQPDLKYLSNSYHHDFRVRLIYSFF